MTCPGQPNNIANLGEKLACSTSLKDGHFPHWRIFDIRGAPSELLYIYGAINKKVANSY